MMLQAMPVASAAIGDTGARQFPGQWAGPLAAATITGRRVRGVVAGRRMIVRRAR